MLSAEDIAATKIAITLCNTSEHKREILHIPVVDCKSKYGYGTCDNKLYRDIKRKWDENLENKTSVILENLGLGNRLQEKVNGLVLLIGMRILSWAKFHEHFLGISRDFSINFFNDSLFTSRGIIDNKKAAEELMKGQRLSTKQMYKLACLHCFVDKIPVLFIQMSDADKMTFYNLENQFIIERQHVLVKFWTYFGVCKVGQMTMRKSVAEIMLHNAIESGCKSAVDFCLERSVTNRNKKTLIDVASNIIRACYYNRHDFPTRNESDWIIFKHSNNCPSRCDSWKPSDYYVDILCSLYDEMNESQRIEFLMKDIQGESYEDSFEIYEYCGVLSYLLFWPYQYYFMKAINLTWDFLSEWIFADLLVKICDKIDSGKGSLKNGEGKIFNYRKLIKEFWCDAPLRFKIYIFSKIDIVNDFYRRDNRKCCKDVLRKLFLLKEFTNEDRGIIELVLESTTDEEKRDIILSKEGENLCIDLIKVEKWGRFNIFVSCCFSSTEDAHTFKRMFIFKKSTQAVCIQFARDEKWEAAESFMKWTAFSHEELIQLKRKMIHSAAGKSSFHYLYFGNSPIADKFCEWFALCEEESREFKKDLSFAGIGF